MNNYLLAIGWWNFVGSIMMLGFFNQSFGKKMLNDWCKIFVTEFKLDYWSKLWLFWAVGLNIFFGAINIVSVKWGYEEVKRFLILFDVGVYVLFVVLSIWGIVVKRLAAGIYAAFAIFLVWIIWGVWALYQ